MTFYDGLLYIWTTIAITITMLFTMMAVGCAHPKCKPVTNTVDGQTYHGQWCEDSK